MKVIKRFLRRLIRTSGYELKRITQPGRGADPFADMKYFLGSVKQPTIIDVGGNVGQSVDRFRRTFPSSVIHSFEPSPSTYQVLQEHCVQIPGVQTWNCGAGSSNATMTFVENDHSDMSSFLPPSSAAWGTVIRTTDVPVITVDSFARRENIEFIHVLKSDTQGYDFEVFKGSEGLMRSQKIALIYFEFIFSDMYHNLPVFDEVFRFLRERDFSLVAIYDQHFQDDLVGWVDALFISHAFRQHRGLVAEP